MTIKSKIRRSRQSTLVSLRCIRFALIRCATVAGLGLWANADDAASTKLSAEQAEFFETKIRLVFANECFKCHSDEAKKACAPVFCREFRGAFPLRSFALSSRGHARERARPRHG